MKKLLITAFAVVFGGMAGLAMAQPANEGKVQTLDELLNLVKQGKVDEAKENRQREAEFLAKKADQANMLKQAENDRAAQERRSEQLEGVFQENERKLGDLQKQLDTRLGSLKELFGVIQQVSGDARATFQQSIISAEYPGRDKSITALIDKVSSGSKLPSMGEIEGLWYQIQREMTESGKVVAFDTNVLLPDGSRQKQEVVRIGTFNLISKGKYLQYIAKTGDIAQLIRQPAGRFLDTAEDLQNAKGSGKLVRFAIDPSRGSILGLLIQAPSLSERIDQGGIIGYVTLVLGAIAMLLVAERIVYLLAVGSKVKAQVKSDEIRTDNPLGRVLSVYQDNKTVDVETLELKLDEAIMKETPPLERFLTLIKIISAVAPLLGLLGTVTGMIQTFQAMTLFGTGDPKLMAGGISQALVTTVIGLVVALPTLFLHSLVAGWSKRIVHTLEEQSAGIIAVHAEQEHKNAGTV